MKTDEELEALVKAFNLAIEKATFWNNEVQRIAKLLEKDVNGKG